MHPLSHCLPGLFYKRKKDKWTHGWHQNDTIEQKYKKYFFFTFSESWGSA